MNRSMVVLTRISCTILSHNLYISMVFSVVFFLTKVKAFNLIWSHMENAGVHKAADHRFALRAQATRWRH